MDKKSMSAGNTLYERIIRVYILLSFSKNLASITLTLHLFLIVHTVIFF